MAGIMHCYRHPNRETRISCATCGRPICTECMVQTDVGIKCPDDARLPRGARAGDMKNDQLAKTILVGLGVAVVGLPVAYLLTSGLGFFAFLISAAAGYGAGRLIYMAGGRNGGPIAMTVAALAVAIPFLAFVVPVILSGGIPLLPILAATICVIAAVSVNR